MAKPAKKMDFEAQQAEEQEAPISGERLKTIEELAAEGGPEEAQKTIGKWETAAVRNVHKDSALAIEHARREGEESVTAQLEEDRKKVLDEIRAETEAAKRKMAFEKSVPPTPEAGLHEKEISAGLEVLKESLVEKAAELKKLKELPKDKQTEKDKLQLSILSDEVEELKAKIRKEEVQSDIEDYQGELHLLNADLLAFLMKQDPANENGFSSFTLTDKNRIDAMIGMLPFTEEGRGRAQQIQNRREELEENIKERKARLAEAGLTLVALHRALNKGKAQLRSIEDAESMEEDEARKQEEEKKRKDEEARAKREKEEAAGRKKEASKGSFTRAAGGGVAAVGAGVGVSFLGIGKVFSWLDKGLKRLAEGDVVETIKGVLLLPEKFLGWIEKKLGVEEKDEKK